MAQIEYLGDLPKPIRNEENRIKQGDYVFCKASGGAICFWGIYSESLKTVVDLNGAGSNYICGAEIYLGDTYNYWTITKRIPCNNVKITIDEI